MDSGPAPTNSTPESPTTVLGTEEMRYVRARSGKPVTSTASTLMRGLSTANWIARRTARGQYGQPGVEKTRRRRSRSSAASAVRVGSESRLAPRETSRTASTRLPNS